MTLKGNKSLIQFDTCFEISRNCNEANLYKELEERYQEENYSLKMFYEEKKELTQIRKETTLIKGSITARNILIIAIVEKLPT